MSSCSACSTTAGTYCPAGTSSGTNKCPTGGYCPNNTTRTLCPSHTYNSKTGQTSISECTACPAGKQYLGTGGTASTVCSSCPGGTSSTAGNPCCPAGYTSANKQCTGTLTCTTGTVQTNATCKSTQTPTCQTSGDTYSAGNCVRTITAGSCPTGYTAISSISQCNVGTYTSGICSIGFGYTACPTGSTLYNGLCLVRVQFTTVCPSGFSGFDGNYCFAIPTCPIGSTYDTTVRLCKSTTGVYTTTTTCKNTQICTTATCLEGTFDTTYGVCKGSAPTCPTYQGIYSYPVSDGMCWASTLLNQPTTCSPGWTYDSAKYRCKATPTCPTGSSIDSVSNLCVYPYASCSQGKVQCTGGQYYDSINKVCIYGKASCPTASYTLSGTTCTLST